MKIEIDDRTVDEIMQSAVKDEVDFLVRELLHQPKVREQIWKWLLTAMPKRGIEAAGVDPKELVDLEDLPAPDGKAPSLRMILSGGGGGAAPDDDGDNGSGGGGGGNLDDDGNTGSGGGSISGIKAAPRSRKKR